MDIKRTAAVGVLALFAALGLKQAIQEVKLDDRAIHTMFAESGKARADATNDHYAHFGKAAGSTVITMLAGAGALGLSLAGRKKPLTLAS